MGEKQREPRNTAAESDDRAGSQPEQNARGDAAHLPPPARNLPRTATEMAPGIPAGSGQGIDEALQQPDSGIGGGVAGDTTAGVHQATAPRGGSADAGERGREPESVRSEDKDRTTL